MLSVLQTVGLTSLWLVAAMLAPIAVKTRGHRLQLWVVIALVATELTMYRADIQRPLYDVVNGHAVFLGVHMISILEAAGVLWLLGAAAHHRRYRWAVPALSAAVAAAMTAIYIDAGQPTPTLDTPPDLPLAYWHILSIYHSAAHLLAMVLCLHAARRVEQRTMRASLLALAAGMLLLCLPWLLNLGWLLTDDDAWTGPIPKIDAVTGLCIALSAAPPLVTGARRWLADRIALRELDSLWRELTLAVPEVVLPAPAAPKRALRRPQLVLYRRVVEIRDAMLDLRDYATDQILDSARQHVADHGVTGDRSEGAITACWLAAARQRKREGAPAVAQPHDLVGPGGGDDLDAEVKALLAIAEHHDSPLVKSFAATLPEPRPTST